MDLKEFLIPVPASEIIKQEKAHGQQWIKQIGFYGLENVDFKEYELALIGIEEDRENPDGEGADLGISKVREELYKLYNWHSNFNLVDMGTVKRGQSIRDSYAALSAVVVECLSNQVIPIIVGGTHDMAYGQFMAYGYQDERVNMVVFDERIDLEQRDDRFTSDAFLYQILTYEPNILGQYVQAGFQHCLNQPNMVETLKKLHFETYRLAELTQNPHRLEPLVRDADLISLDLSVLKHADACGQKNNTPTGMSAEVACQLARFAGISDRLSSFGIHEYYAHKDEEGRTAQLIAQIIWHFVDGYYSRKNDHPDLTADQYTSYIVPLLEEGQELVFLKSTKSDRWWMKIPKEEANGKAFTLVPCLYEDYLQATREEIPDRWMDAFLRVAN